jgi:hypothetical protein
MQTLRRVPESVSKDVASKWLECRPSWGFSKADGHRDDMDPKPLTFGWHLATETCGRDVLVFLRQLENNSWKEILFQDDGKRNHSIASNRLCPEAQERLRALKLDDFEMLYSFRVTKRKRLWGIRVDHTLFILWWDPEHLVYPSGP